MQYQMYQAQLEILKELAILIVKNRTNPSSTRNNQIESLFTILKPKLTEIDLENLRLCYVNNTYFSPIEKEQDKFIINVLSLGNSITAEFFSSQSQRNYNMYCYAEEILTKFKNDPFMKNAASQKGLQDSLFDEPLSLHF